jgi:hypothetical protein
MKTYVGNEGRVSFLTSVLDGGESSASCPCVRAPSTHWIEGEVDPRANLDAVAKRKDPFPTHFLGSNPVRPRRSLVTILTELPWLPPDTNLLKFDTPSLILLDYLNIVIHKYIHTYIYIYSAGLRAGRSGF